MIESKHFGQELFVLESTKDKYSNKKGWVKKIHSNKTYNIQGKNYDLVEKRERFNQSSAKRIAGIAVGIFCCLFTLCFALCSKTVRQFFTGRQVVKIVKLKGSNPPGPNPLPNPGTNPIPNPGQNPIPIPNPILNSIPGSNPSKPAGPVSPYSISFEGLPEFNGYRWTSKIFDAPTPTADKSAAFTPLTKSQVVKLLGVCPELKNMLVANDTMKAYDSILSIHEKGIAKLDPFSNGELIKQMQFILFTIDQIKINKDKVELLKEVAKRLEGCAAATQGDIGKLYAKLTCKDGGFNTQMENFISNYKDNIFDQTLYSLYPEMQKPDHAIKTFGTPKEQFGHVKAGFVAAFDQIGLNSEIAKKDPNRNEDKPVAKREEFKQTFSKKISIYDFVKEFVIDVNGRMGHFCMGDLFNWSAKHDEIAADISYDEDFKYPVYAAPYKKTYGFEPYITESLAFTILEKLGYLSKI